MTAIDPNKQGLRLEPFRASHAARLGLRDQAAEALSGHGPVYVLARAYEAAGPGWTISAHGWPLACGGVVRFWPGVGELWCWTGADAGRWCVGFAREARGFVEGLLRGGGYHRVQAHVREADPRAARFVEFLGLAREGRCPGFGPDGTTHLLYGRYAQWKV